MRLEDGSMESIPLVMSPEDLIGKRIRHQFELKNGDTKWYWGTIISKDKNKKNPVFEIKYDRHKKIYHLKDMMTDYQNEDLKLVPITPDDLIGKTIFHLHTDKDSGSDSWWKATVVDADDYDPKNPQFFVFYHDDDNDDEEEEDFIDPSQYYLCNLLEDYLNGWLRFAE